MKVEQIDTSTLAGKIEVMKLAAAGREVVARTSNTKHDFGLTQSPCWDWFQFDYAIAAEAVGPNEVYVVLANGFVMAARRTKESADKWAKNNGGTVVRYVRAD